MADQKDIDEFRLRFRVAILERLVLKTALVAPLLDRHLSIQESLDSLKGWLDLESEVADQTYGRHFADPALTALYADEVKEMTENMKKQVDRFAGLWKKSRES
jgi:hypothetical protein